MTATATTALDELAELFDPTRFKHGFPDAPTLARARAERWTITALCGHRGVPRDAAELAGLPVCPICSELRRIIGEARATWGAL